MGKIVYTSIMTTEIDEQETGICNSCGNELEPIYENNGFTAPDPTHYEITGYKPCVECNTDYDAAVDL